MWQKIGQGPLVSKPTKTPTHNDNLTVVDRKFSSGDVLEFKLPFNDKESFEVEKINEAEEYLIQPVLSLMVGDAAGENWIPVHFTLRKLDVKIAIEGLKP
jgi:hypothetical protein